ncbi:DNA-directed RNA polymerase sigma-70 factor [Nitrospira sp.]|nr:DNA-directed RNA polymerase sigma-70 factor [Nitrospira sp.]
MKTEPAAILWMAAGFFVAPLWLMSVQPTVLEGTLQMTLTFAHIEDLFHRYREELTRRLFTMVHSRETAADLVQETYVRLLRLADTQPVEQPRALLHRIATNLAIDHLRASRNGLDLADSLDEATAVACEAPSQERDLLGKERFRLFLQSIEQLPPRCREAFLLHRVYGYSYREIAAQMGISDSGVEKLLMRALEQHCAVLERLDRRE